MPLSNSIESYADCRVLLDKALDSPKGLRIKMNTPGEVTRLAHRCNKFRVLDRAANRRLFPKENEWHNASAYDGLSLSRQGLELHIVRLDRKQMEVEEL